MAKDHKYKGFEIWKNGTKECPWNIYKMEYSKFLNKEVPTHVGYAETLKGCKYMIDEGIIDEVK